MNRTETLMNMDNPKQLEKLYRDNETAFKSTFNALYPELSNEKLAAYWKERLNYESAEISWGSSQELTFVIIAALVAGVLAKIPVLLNIAPDFFLSEKYRVYHFFDIDHLFYLETGAFDKENGRGICGYFDSFNFHQFAAQ